MANDAARAAYWQDFVIARCGFPNPERLAEQFEGAEFADFCDCGCNSFGVVVRPGTPPLARNAKQGGVVFNADFAMGTSNQLEIMLSVDKAGNLDRVDIMCNANSSPVSDPVFASLQPFRVSASKYLIV